MAVHLSCPVDALERRGTGYVLRTPHGPVEADRVVLCTPAPAAARLLADLAPDAAAGLAELEYASAAMVSLAVRRSDLEHPLDASGFLVGAADRLPTLTACSWASAKWAHLGRPRRRDPAGLRRPPRRRRRPGALRPDLVDALCLDLATTMGLPGPPGRAAGDPVVGRPPPVPAGPPRTGAGVA